MSLGSRRVRRLGHRTFCDLAARQTRVSAYPLVTSISLEKKEEKPLDLRDSLARKVEVQRIDTLDEAHGRGLEAAKQGAAVAIIRYTVDEAIASYEAISRHFDKVLIFHARFAMAADEGDPRRGWALSEVSLRKSRCSGASNPPDVQRLVEAAQHGWTLSEKEIPVVVLNPTDDERWQATARGKGAGSISVFYSKSAGLQFAGNGS